MQLVLEHGDDGLRAEAVGPLKGLRIKAPEACLLYIWDEPAGLPLDYLRLLADPDRTQDQLEAARPLISTQICRYLNATKDRLDLEDRRLYAVQHLGTFFSNEAERILVCIMNDRKLGLLHKASKTMRAAAELALDAGRRRVRWS